MAAAFLVLALISTIQPTVAVSVESGSVLSRDLATNLKERPVMKVVRLLKDMEAELNKELEDDKQVYEMLSCWCQTNEKEKTKAIELGTSTAAELEASLSADAAKVVALKAKRKDTMDEMYADQKALGQANELRIKENKAFQAEKVDLIEAIKACEQAVTVLSKHHPELAQIKSVAQMLQKARVSELVVSSSMLGRGGSRVLKDFLQGVQSASSFLAIPGFRSYAPQSGQIFGVLKQMKKDFSDNLDASTATEKKAQAEYEALKLAKEDEIATAQKQVVQIDTDIAALGEKAAQEAKQLEDTNRQLALDSEFLKNLKSKCQMTDKEFEERTKSRLEEIAAVEETIAILNSDEAFDNFGKTLGAASFLQLNADTQSKIGAGEYEEAQQRKNAVAVLQKAAALTGAPQLALIAASVQLDAFTKVKADIDKLVDELTKQQDDEVAHRDWCTSEMNTNKRETAAGYDKKTALENKLADLKKEIESLAAKIKETDATAAETQVQMKRASETREGENAAFQETVTDQRLTQAILDKALARMKQVYALLQQEPGAPHIQTSGNHTDPGNGPARFTKYEQHAGGLRVVSMIETIIADSKKLENEAIASEEDAQEAYEDFMKDSNKALKKYAETIVNLSEAKAKAESGISMAKSDLSLTMKELEGLNSVMGDLHGSCDYLLKNFDARQEARAAEIAALHEAKAILSGMQ